MPLWTGKDNSLASEDEHMVRPEWLPVELFRRSNGLQCWYATFTPDALDIRCAQAKFLKKFEGIAAAQLGGEGAAESKGR
jgi:hypothetical protein